MNTTSKKTFEVRPVKISDVRELLDIYTPYVINTAISFELEPPSLEDFTQRIDDISKNFPYFVAIDGDNKIVGYCYAHTLRERAAYNHCVEVSIYVDADCRGKGVGRILYAHLETQLKLMGITNLYASVAYNEAESKHAPHQSKLFHERMGYTTVGCFHRCGKKFNEWFDMIWMEKLI